MKSKRPPLLSLVIPCYNESGNLQRLVERCSLLVSAAPVEVIFVDNGSSDSSQQELKEYLSGQEFMRMVIVESNQGYGFGIRAGLDSCKTPFLGWTHADLQTDPLDAERGLQLLLEDPSTHFVKGQRFGRPISDRFFTAGMSLFESLLLREALWDINAQPTLFRRDFYSTWREAPNDFSLDLFAYYSARSRSLTVARFPVFFGERFSGSSHWNYNWQARRNFILRTLSYSISLRGSL